MRRSNPDCMSGGGQAGTDHPWPQRPIGLEENAGRRLSRLAYGGDVAGWRTGEARQVGHGLLPVRRPADVDYRLARQTTLDGWRRGSLGREVLCDAQPMLRRNAVECGTPGVTYCGGRVVAIAVVIGAAIAVVVGTTGLAWAFARRSAGRRSPWLSGGRDPSPPTPKGPGVRVR